MKKLISLFTIALFLCISMSSNAQVATNYAWSQASSTYTPITGGTVVATATANSGAGSLDDVIYNLPSGTIPFSFLYDGNSYTGCNISSNGFITFGTTAPSGTNYTPLSNTATYAGAIAAVGGDNNSLFLSPLIGEIRYETVGSEFVIQYSNFKPFAATTASPYWVWNFQIRLHSNGSVRIVYNNSFVGAPVASLRQVGLRGPSNAFATNVNNRLITNGTHTWTTSVAGTTNSSTCGQSSTIPNVPPSGHTYVWTPPIVVAVDVGISTASVGSLGQIISVGKGYNVNATVKNFGTTTQNSVPVFYTVNGGSPVGPVNTVGPIVQNATENVVFNGGNSFVALSAGSYTVKVYTALAGDGVATNDTTTLIVNVQQKIASFPYVQTFTNPVDWTIVIENPVGTTALWGLGICTSPDGKTPDTAATSNCYNGSTGRREVLRSPEMDLSGMTNPVLNFYVAYRTFTDGSNDSMAVVISTDGGVTFMNATTVYNKSRNSVPSLTTLPGSSAAFFPSTERQWRHETVSLANVANSGNVVIGFKSISGFGNRQWVDNVIVSNVDGLCTDAVSATGSYTCNPNVTLNFTTLLLPPAINQVTDNHSNSNKNVVSETGIVASNMTSVTGDVRSLISSPATDNINGGTAFVAQYTNVDPGQNVAVNTTATTQSGLVYTPVNVYFDYWFNITYNGNDSSGYATYDISIDLGNLVFPDPNDLYIVKRSDRVGAWVCQNTTVSGNKLVVTGLTDFSDFAIAGDAALPVELSSFTSTINRRDVTLNWATASETNNAGFDIERSSVGGQWSKVGNVNGNGTSTTPHNYSFTESNLASGKYNYRLKQVDFNGNFEYFNLSNEIGIGVPTNFDLSQNYPNPFNPSTKINYDLPFDSKVSIKLYDMSGKEVANIVNEVKTAGYYTINFNASNLSSGVYFYKISAEANGNNFVSTKKMMLVK